MWISNSDDEVTNLETGHKFILRSQNDHRGIRTWEIASARPSLQTVVLREGYVTYEDALSAYEKLLNDLEIEPVEIQSPSVERVSEKGDK